MRASATVTAVCFSIIAVAAAGDGRAAMRLHTDISAQRLETALQALARDRDLQVICRTEVVGDLRTSGASGELTTDEALTQLLAGTGLTYRYLPSPSTSPAITIFPAQTAEPPISLSANLTDRVRLAQAEQGSASSSTGGDAAASQKLELEEIVVTAEKRLERMQDVPVPVTAINADALVNSNQRRLQDYYATVPGLNLTLGARNEANLAIRGITAYAGNPTVGVLIDDVPYGTATEAAGGYVVPDLDPSDLARIEVLRGPQGTLYGANSMGGLLKYVTLDPSMERFSGRVQLGTSGIDGSDELGYSVRGSVNVPLGDTLAIRASGFTRREPGYIDNPAEGLEDVNSLDTHGGRLAALWRPSESFSLKLSALLQRSERNGAPNVTQGLGDLDQSNLRNTGASVGDYQAYSATVDASLGRADLVAISGYNINKIFNSLDFTPVFGFPSQARFGVPGSVISENKKTEKFTQEVRVSAPLGERIDGLVGVYYANENSPARGSFVATDPATGSVAGTWYTNNSPTSYEEYSAFTNLTFKLTDRFDVQLGGRESYTRQIIDDTILSGPFVTQFLLAPTETAITPGRRSKDHAFTYLFTPRYKLSSDVMAYARFASGYRGGGSNGPLPGARPSFDPDQTFNYELGLKGDLLGKALSIDASVYYIDWKDVQITVTDALSKVSYTDNAGRARSQGVELAIESRPLTGLKVSGWVAWNDATFTDFPASSPVISKDGDRLPFSSRFSGYVSVDQEFPLSPSVTGSVGGALRYVGERIGQLGAFPDRQEYPAYAQTDLRAGLDLSAWAMSVNLFVNNVTDRRGLLSGGTGFAVSSAFTYIQPRTVGLSLARDF